MAQGTIALSAEQRRGVANINRRLDAGQQVIKVIGPAGCGKSVVAAHYARRPGARGLALTGKAASILRRRGVLNATTIHSHVYGAPTEMELPDGRVVLDWTRRLEPPAADLLVIDETSMVGDDIGRDLIQIGIPIIAFEDSLQLPPFGGRAPFFDNFDTDVAFTEIHRQALNSQPLRLATRIREAGTWRAHKYYFEDLDDADIIIVALNETRRRTNNRIRRYRFGIRDAEALPIVDENVLCFRNNYTTGVLNGTIWTVEAVKHSPKDRNLLHLDISNEFDGARSVVVPTACFTKGVGEGRVPRHLDIFDFGYSLTCHKAQGSEWPTVSILDETHSPGFEYMAKRSRLGPDEFARRWAYVAASRASERAAFLKYS
jgi:exodeoxyribonuclease V